mgnify:CR=1 FL=1|tara:strand:+ start:5524 stop:6426 length:903 start_codon:yes stop_codon:yes gene_type:complete
MTTFREQYEESIPLLSDQDLADQTDPTRRGTGMKPSKKRYQWNEIYGMFDPDSISASQKAPDHVQSAFEELIGGEPDYKLRLHPWFKRWAAFERVRGAGEGAYACFSVFMGAGEEGYLPADLDNSDGRYENMRGRMGDYRLPSAEDFKVLRKDADVERLGVDQVVARLEKPENEQEREKERVLQDREWDVLDYNYLKINAAANGGKLQMVAPNRDLSEIIAKKEDEWYTETKTTEDGKTYKVRMRKNSRAYAEVVAGQIKEHFVDNWKDRMNEIKQEKQKAKKEQEKEELKALARSAIGL